VLLPRQQAKLARGAKDKEHAMSQTPNTAIAVIGIDIGKTGSTSWATMRAAPSCCGKNGRVAKWKRGSPIYWAHRLIATTDYD
jgi:hypothetical protein